MAVPIEPMAPHVNGCVPRPLGLYRHLRLLQERRRGAAPPVGWQSVGLLAITPSFPNRSERRRLGRRLRQTCQIGNIRLNHFAEDGEIDVSELLHVQAALAGFDLAEPFEVSGEPVLQASHEIERESAFA